MISKKAIIKHQNSWDGVGALKDFTGNYLLVR